jgi:hypothetical protein
MGSFLVGLGVQGPEAELEEVEVALELAVVVAALVLVEEAAVALGVVVVLGVVVLEASVLPVEEEQAMIPLTLRVTGKPVRLSLLNTKEARRPSSDPVIVDEQ